MGGPRCDACMVGYWGISYSGCKKCAPCTEPVGGRGCSNITLLTRRVQGHVCDPDTGRCVCPRLTEGAACERCAVGSWDLDPYRGCKQCKCHRAGSVGGQCDQETGRCRCLEGFEGEQCDRCRPGHYNFPNCQACNCHPAGTEPEACK